MKSEKLTSGGGDPKAPDSFYFDSVTFQVFTTGGGDVHLIGKRQSITIVSVRVNRYTRTFNVFRAENEQLTVFHLIAMERLLLSYALTLNFSIMQVLLPLFGTLTLKSLVECGGDLESFPGISS